MKPNVLVVIPTYRCKDQIPRLLRRFDPNLLDHIRRVIVIDNGSGDGTAEAAREAGRSLGLLDRFEVIVNPRNLGLGGTFKRALELASEGGYEWLAFLHGDDQADPHDLPRMLEIADSEPALDAIWGSRFMPGSRRTGYSRKRELGNRFFNVAFSLVSGNKILDIGSGLNLFRVQSVPRKTLAQIPDHIAFDAWLMLELISLGREQRYVPIQWSQSDQISTVRDFRLGLRLLWILFQWKARQLRFEAPTLQIVMPMAGRAERFKQAGTRTPKPLIPVSGTPMFRRALAGLDSYRGKTLLWGIINEWDERDHSLSSALKELRPDMKILLTRPTRGPLETVMACARELDPREPLLILDCDLSFDCPELLKSISCAARLRSRGIGGALLYFESALERYSFLRIEGDRVVEIAEKKRISGFAVAGAYFFTEAGDFIEAGRRVLERPPPPQLEEYFVSAAIQELLTRGKKLIGLRALDYRSFGTPEELEKETASLRG